MRLHLINGLSPSYITRATDISVWFPCGTTHQLRFLITKLNTEFPAVIGLDWLILHNVLINWADSSVTFRGHPDISPVITPQSVLANQAELSSDDVTASDFLENLPDPNPNIIPDPNPDFISNLTFNSIPTSNSNLIPDPTS